MGDFCNQPGGEGCGGAVVDPLRWLLLRDARSLGCRNRDHSVPRSRAARLSAAHRRFRRKAIPRRRRADGERGLCTRSTRAIRSERRPTRVLRAPAARSSSAADQLCSWRGPAATPRAVRRPARWSAASRPEQSAPRLPTTFAGSLRTSEVSVAAVEHRVRCEGGASPGRAQRPSGTYRWRIARPNRCV
jgi:hypothetical protein